MIRFWAWTILVMFPDPLQPASGSGSLTRTKLDRFSASLRKQLGRGTWLGQRLLRSNSEPKQARDIDQAKREWLSGRQPHGGDHHDEEVDHYLEEVDHHDEEVDHHVGEVDHHDGKADDHHDGEVDHHVDEVDHHGDEEFDHWGDPQVVCEVEGLGGRGRQIQWSRIGGNLPDGIVADKGILRCETLVLKILEVLLLQVWESARGWRRVVQVHDWDADLDVVPGLLSQPWWALNSPNMVAALTLNMLLPLQSCLKVSTYPGKNTFAMPQTFCIYLLLCDCQFVKDMWNIPKKMVSLITNFPFVNMNTLLLMLLVRKCQR